LVAGNSEANYGNGHGALAAFGCASA